MRTHATVIFITLLFFAFSKNTSFAQEIRLSGSVQSFGYINGGFNGIGIGLEAPASRKWALIADLSRGSQTRGKATEAKAAIVRYFGKGQKGFFIGPSMKYVNLKETGNNDQYDDSLYGLGVSFGLKTTITERLNFFFAMNPHVGFGGRNVGDVGGISGQLGLSYRFVD